MKKRFELFGDSQDENESMVWDTVAAKRANDGFQAVSYQDKRSRENSSFLFYVGQVHLKYFIQFWSYFRKDI